MTSEESSSANILELKQRDYKNALISVRSYLEQQKAPYLYAEVGAVVEKVLTTLAEGVPDPYFYPLQKGTYFYRNLAPGFSTLYIFHANSSEPVDVHSQMFWIFNFIYAYRFEALHEGQALNDLDAAILSIPQKTPFPAFAAAQLELFRSRITAELAVSKQTEIRNSIRAETEAAAQRLGNLVDSIKGWEGKLDYWKSKTADLEKLIKDQHEDLNFVGLSKAFSDLIKKRTIELRKVLHSVKLFGTAAIFFPSIAFYIGSQFHSARNLDWSVLTYAIPTVTIELLLLYFFRLSIRNEYSLKAQLLQLELRYSVCAFIQGYAEFAKSVRADDADKTLEKFEALVFSGITADIQNIPSQFDGIEQLVSLVKGIRAKD